jgi:DNA-binding CsgD family transcriptional regulator
MTIGNASNVSEPPTVPGGGGSTITRTPLLPSERKATLHLARRAGSRHDSAELSPAVDLRAALLDAATAAADAAARARAVADALDEALAELTVEQTISPETSSPMVDLLSPREQEVLALVADGCTNKAIAETLFVSPNTVKTHVTSLLHKLQADTRVQLAAIATRQGLLPGARVDPI